MGSKGNLNILDYSRKEYSIGRKLKGDKLHLNKFSSCLTFKSAQDVSESQLCIRNCRDRPGVQVRDFKGLFTKLHHL